MGGAKRGGLHSQVSENSGSPGSIRTFNSASPGIARTIRTSSGIPTLIERLGGVDRDQADLQRVIEVDVVGDRAIEHRLAVLVLADLQIRRVLRALDEVAGGITQTTAVARP